MSVFTRAEDQCGGREGIKIQTQWSNLAPEHRAGARAVVVVGAGGGRGLCGNFE